MTPLDEYDIQEAFAVIEEDLIKSMMRNMQRHRVEEAAEGMEWSMWQAEQLKALEKYKKVNRKSFQKQFSYINSSVDNLINQARQRGSMDQEIEILEAIKKGFKPSRALTKSTRTSAEFFKLNDRKLEALIRATKQDLQKAETAMLRMANDQYRKTIFNAQVYANTGAGTYEKAVDMAAKDFLSSGINCIEYKNGARVNIASYAAMALRTASKRAYLTGEGEKRQEWGISTVIMNKRGAACPKCLPFVGKVFIDDVWSGGKTSDGDYPLLSSAIAKGLYHPNCKDSHTTYFEGITTHPKPMTQEDINKAANNYRLEQEQKYNERMARKYKMLSDGSLDADNEAGYQAKFQEWKTRNSAFIKQHEDVLRQSRNAYSTKNLNLDGKTLERLQRENQKLRNGLAAGNISAGIPDHNKPIVLEKVDFSDADMVSSKLKDYEKLIADSPIENAIVITRAGDIKQCFGTLNGVYPDIDLGNELKGAYVTHNHPIGSDNEYSFSAADIGLFADHNLEILRGIDEKYVYELNRNPNDIDQLMEIGQLNEENSRHNFVIDEAMKRKIGYRRRERGQ